MKKLFICFFIPLIVTFAFVKAHDVEENIIDNLSVEQINQISETYGHLILMQINKLPIELNTDQIIIGINKSVAKEEPPMELNTAIQVLMALERQALKNQGEENLTAANEFLETNKTKPDIITLEDGKIQYQILQQGTGEEVKEDFVPELSYEGKFINDDVFDSSEKRGGPQKMPLTRTIAGFKKGVIGMKEGEKRRIFIHPDLGYGTQKMIMPNALLIFEVEIIKANTKADAAPIAE